MKNKQSFRSKLIASSLLSVGIAATAFNGAGIALAEVAPAAGHGADFNAHAASFSPAPLPQWKKRACIPNASKGGTLKCVTKEYPGPKPPDADSNKYGPLVCPGPMGGVTFCWPRPQ